MKNKMLQRLIVYFVSSIVTFAVAIGLIFSFLFARHNLELHKIELERQAVAVAGSLADMLDASATGGGMGMRGMGGGMGGRHRGGAMGGLGNISTYISLVEEIVSCYIWIVDRESVQIDFGNRHRHMQTNTTFTDIPEYAEQIISLALAGQTSTSEGFSDFLGVPTISAVAPIVLRTGQIFGAVILHSYIADADNVTTGGLNILLMSILVAIAISCFLALTLSMRFTDPLKKMKVAAVNISNGNYTAKTGVSQSDEIGELALVLDDMAERLQTASKESEHLEKLRRDFVANISHELRTPVTVIRGSLEALIDEVVTDREKTKEFHMQMFKECSYLERLVSDLLDLAKLQNIDFDIDMSVVNINDVMEDCVRAMAQVSAQKNVALNWQVAERELNAVGDYGRLRQLFVIVIDNAIKFSPVGGGVTITAKKTAEHICIDVEDGGTGIPHDDLANIFERFYKQKSEENKAGTGLGLPIAKQIAQRHNGNIVATNVKGGGAKISISIPITANKNTILSQLN